MTAAAQSIVLLAILVSKSNENVTNGAGKGSVLNMSWALQEIIRSVGYIPDPPTSCILFKASSESVVSEFLDFFGDFFVIFHEKCKLFCFERFLRFLPGSVNYFF